MEDGEAVARTTGPGRTAVRDGPPARPFFCFPIPAFRRALATWEQAGSVWSRPVRQDGGARPKPRPIGGSTESRHLHLGRLAVERLAGILDRPLEGLPVLTDDVLVSRNGAFGGHA